MTTYTEEDFKTAQFARHPDGAIAAVEPCGDTMPWRTDSEIWLSDADMADHGWVPVREAADQPITLDALHDAWETAEVADERNEGDVLIFRHQDSSTERVQVWRSVTTGPMTPYVRILRRAPKPKRPEGAEQLEALLDEWGDLTRGEEPTPLADWLAARGVRVTEGGDK